MIGQLPKISNHIDPLANVTETKIHVAVWNKFIRIAQPLVKGTGVPYDVG